MIMRMYEIDNVQQEIENKGMSYWIYIDNEFVEISYSFALRIRIACLGEYLMGYTKKPRKRIIVQKVYSIGRDK